MQNGRKKNAKLSSQIIRTFKNTFASVTKVFDVSRLSQIQLFQDQVKSPAWNCYFQFFTANNDVSLNYIQIRHGLMLLWFKNLMNATEKLQFIDPTFRHSCLVPSLYKSLWTPVSTLSVKVDSGQKIFFVILSKERYHTWLSIFYLFPFHTWGTSKISDVF